MKARIPPLTVLIIALGAALLSLAFTWQGYLAEAGQGLKFLGFRYMAGDHFQYAGFIRQARDTGSVFMTDPFTAEPQKGVFVLLYFWVLGVFCRLTGASVTAAWEVFRVTGVFLYVIIFWFFTESYFEKIRTRILATALFAFGGGLGWLVALLRVALFPSLKPLEYPYDYYWNWCTFGTAIVPNWIWPALCLLLACHAVVRSIRGRDIVVFLLLPTVWFLHAYSGMVAYALFGLLPLMPLARAAARLRPLPWNRARSNLRIALPGLASFGIVAAYLVWSRSDPVFATISHNGFLWTDSFNLWWYPLGYGALLPLAWRGRKPPPKEDPLRSDLILSWLAAAFVLSVQHYYAGVKFQYLLFPPLALMAARGLQQIGTKATTHSGWRGVRLAPAALALVLFLDAPVSLIKDFPTARTDDKIFIDPADLEAMKFLERQPDGIVLTSVFNGNRLPWLAGKTVFAGHWFMTIDVRAKAQMIGEFFSPATPREHKRGILVASGARYVYRGAYEAALSWAVDPSLPLRKIYDSGGVSIYERPGLR
ncbi:MAG TPA: hypothetical protein VGK94_06405 [Candidatus Polarisedimenticolia bacterium]|jgi:hypothetical protein